MLRPGGCQRSSLTAKEARIELVEAAAEGDDELIMKYLEGEELSNEEIIQGLRAAVRNGQVVPIVYSAPQPNIGVRPLMNVVIDLFPAPDQSGPFVAANSAGDEIELEVSDVSPLAAFIFKTREDPYGKFSYIRVYGGILESDSRIWDANLDTEVRVGTLNILRGKPVDQISDLIKQLQTNPNSRRHMISAWNVADIGDMALPPCHCLFQFYVAGGRLSCQLYQRSADIFLGVPFNIASYALLTMMVAQVTGYQVGEFIHTFGDAHLYLNHLEQAEIQLNREPFPKPKMQLNPKIKSLFDFTFEDFELVEYQNHPRIAAPIAV